MLEQIVVFFEFINIFVERVTIAIKNYKDCRTENVSVLIKKIFIVLSNVINDFYWFLFIISISKKE